MVLSIAVCLLMITSISTSITQNVGQSSSTLGGTIYVDDDNISGIEDGTIAHPYNTIQEGVDAASYGDTIYVFNGTYQENVIIDKSLILQGEDIGNTIIDGGGIGSVVEITAPSVEFMKFKVQNTGTTFSDSGVKVDSNNNIISDVLSEGTFRGVYVPSDNNLVKNIVCVNNGNYGIEVDGDWNRIINCITNNTGTFGIFIRKGDYNQIRDSYSTLNHLGFQIMHGKFNKIENCTAYDNNYGIRLHAYVYNCCIAESSCINNNKGILLEMEVNNNTITGCLLENNEYGIWIREYTEYYINYPSVNNLIFNNVFMGNTIQAYDSYSNYWDKGYPVGGNYWCDYSGVDLYNGPNQNIVGSDGIGDTPYTFSNGQDNYPLMNPRTNGNIKPVADAGSDQTVYVGEIVQFNGSGSYDPDGTINFYLWNFGDGTPQEIGISPSHIFNNSGNFTVILEVTDNNCSTGTDTCIINVLEEDSLPVANAGPDQTVNEGDTVKLNGSGSTAGQYFAQNVVALWHMNRGSGNMIYDETDNNHHGTIIGAHWTANGRFGNALFFDGVDDCVEIKPSDQIFGDNPDEWSYMVWFKTNNDVDNMTIISDYSAGDPWWEWNDHTFALDLSLVHDYTPTFPGNMIWSRMGTKNVLDGHGKKFNFSDDKWHFVAVTISKTEDEWKIYIDGVKPSGKVSLGEPTFDYFDSDTIYIGGRWVLDPPGTPGTGELILPFQGIIDEIVLFDRALTAQEIIDYYNSGKEFLLENDSVPAEIVSYEWDFESDGIYDYQETPGNAPDGAFDGITNHVYGDDGIFKATLRVTNNQNLSDTDTCNITVLNVDPKVTIKFAIMDVEIGLRVAGRKYNNVSMTLFVGGKPIGNVSIERIPGSPNDQIAWVPVTLDMTKIYNATVTFTPEDPPNIGANPVWIYIKSQNGSIKKIHHTFNVQQSKKRDSDHWNHVEPWAVDLNAHFIGLPFEITSHITDPGSDDETLTFTYGSQVKTVTYLNNPPNPDPHPSPEVKPMDITDTTTLVYEGPGTVTLVVEDDDNIRLGVGQGSDSFSVG